MMRPSERRSALLISMILTTVSCAITPIGDLETAALSSVDPEPSQAVLLAEAAEIATALSERNTGLLPAEVVHLSRVIVRESHRAGLPPEFVLAVIEVESSGHNFAVSKVGALGLMQIMPATGEFVAARIDLPWHGRETLFDPVANVRLGIHYLESLLARYENVRLALAAYNAGPGDVSRRLRSGEAVPRGYADKVLATYRSAEREI
jgi:soluble lytic murein transglycosylase